MAGNTVTRTTLTVDVGFNDDVTGELGFKIGQILAQAKTDIEKLNENITTSIERKPYRERDESTPRKPRAAKTSIDEAEQAAGMEKSDTATPKPIETAQTGAVGVSFPPKHKAA